MRLIDLYPVQWRERFGDEFLGLLAARPPSFRERVDIVRGAVDAHLYPNLTGLGPARDRRAIWPLLGLATVAATWFMFANAPVVSDAVGQYRDGSAAIPFWLASFVLLGVGVVAILDHLPAEARVGRVAASVAVIASIPFGLAPWLVPAGIVMLGALVVLAVSGLRHGWPRLPAAAMVLTAATPLAILSWMLTRPWYVNRTSDPTPLIVAVLSLIALWPITSALVFLSRRIRPASPEIAEAGVPA